MSTITPDTGMTKLLKWTPTLLLILSAVLGSTEGHNFIEHHTTLVSILGSIAGIITHQLPSPISTSNNS